MDDLSGVDDPSLGDHRGSVDAADLILASAMIPAMDAEILHRQFGFQDLREPLAAAFAVHHIQDATGSKGAPAIFAHEGRTKSQRMIMVLRFAESIAAMTHRKHQGTGRFKVDSFRVGKAPTATAHTHSLL